VRLCRNSQPREEEKVDQSVNELLRQRSRILKLILINLGTLLFLLRLIEEDFVRNSCFSSSLLPGAPKEALLPSLEGFFLVEIR
jgi:hypothetical protein